MRRITCGLNTSYYCRLVLTSLPLSSSPLSILSFLYCQLVLVLVVAVILIVILLLFFIKSILNLIKERYGVFCEKEYIWNEYNRTSVAACIVGTHLSFFLRPLDKYQINCCLRIPLLIAFN